jgi:3'-phosphoadenosine 5'-phosphosulfate sulfotransferase (PAPS reductase)/FAD synthetase
MGKFTYEEYKRLSNLSLRDKIGWSEQLILYVVKRSKGFSVAVSWGKSSTVMLHLINKFCRNGKVIHVCESKACTRVRNYSGDMISGKFKDMFYFVIGPTIKLDHMASELESDTIFTGDRMVNRTIDELIKAGPYHKESGIIYCHPMLIWSDKDLIDYAKQEGIPLLE